VSIQKKHLCVTWLGQAGLWVSMGGQEIVIDPYLSDSVGELDPHKHRRVPVNERFLERRPDIIVCTHDHLDHTDPQTLKHYLTGRPPVTVLASGRAWERVRTFGGDHNYVLFNRFTEWTQGILRFTAVPAEHSDPNAIGFLLTDGEKTFYITGDTLYNRTVLQAVPSGVDAVFLPVNGVGNNMNATDAARFARAICARRVIPVHWGLFDNITPELTDCCGVTVPAIYEEMIF
jgi:L-ascorbate 6-phosphate lactonase